MRMKLFVKVLLWVLGIMIITGTAEFSEGEECQSDLIGLEIECLYYMHKGVPAMQNPNGRCCRAIHEANILCVCSKLTQKIIIPPGYTIEDMLDWYKVLNCLNFCGRPLPPGFKCGHFTVPPTGPPAK
ncbi:uncharacterized protein LOC114745883 [Neltuma alba]|uniref:uncharacterized protein LOC114745883 n=1 Tax=Neltuma alba TaxID=207710 RepID=UPI0010A4ADC2|nr:uncharacterized protein LOC114745883 [Prosopis alba]